MASQRQSDAPKQMGDNGGAAGPKQSDAPGWDEARLEEGMKLLKEIHIQLRGLRSTIPRLLSPLSQKHKSPQTMIRSYQAALDTMKKEVETAKEILVSEETRKVMEYARESRERDGAVRPWMYKDHPGWSMRDT